jgi:hypothetical protein
VKTILPLALSVLLATSQFARADDQRPCQAEDPVRIELGGRPLAIPASYQPRFEPSKIDGENFQFFEQSYYQDGRRLKFRYCRQKGHLKVEALTFHLEFRQDRRNDGYDIRDAIVGRGAPTLSALERISLIDLRSVPKSNEPFEAELARRGFVRSADRRYLFLDPPDNAANPNRDCHANLVSVDPTPFGGRARASCYSSLIHPEIYRWRITTAADAFGRPHGLLTIDLHETRFEDWPPVLAAVRTFIDSMHDAKH